MAEYGWGLSKEMEEKARVELHEFAETKHLAVDAVKEQLETRPDITFLRTDSSFIVRFLRARKYNIYDAFRLLARYFEFRQQNPLIFKNFDTTESGVKAALMDGLPGVLQQTDKCGRKIIVLFSANWDNRSYGLTSIFRAILLTLEKLIEDDSVQINGFVIVIDWSQFTFKQSTWIHPNVLKLMIEGLQDCFPARFGAIHFVNQPWYIEAIFKVMKPFLKHKTKQKIYMHGNNLATLYSHISHSILPAELGGVGASYNLKSWALQLIGDESFSFGEKQIYWPDHCACIKTRSETFPLDQFTSEVKTEEKTTPSGTSHTPSGTRPHLNEEFFLID